MSEFVNGFGNFLFDELRRLEKMHLELVGISRETTNAERKSKKELSKEDQQDLRNELVETQKKLQETTSEIQEIIDSMNKKYKKMNDKYVEEMKKSQQKLMKNRLILGIAGPIFGLLLTWLFSHIQFVI